MCKFTKQVIMFTPFLLFQTLMSAVLGVMIVPRGVLMMMVASDVHAGLDINLLLMTNHAQVSNSIVTDI